MKIRTPDFEKTFRCLMGDCPDSCCRQGWQIVVDEAHEAQYGALGGTLGERVRASLCRADGETVLKMDGGVCRLLDEDGLCPIVSALGEGGLCDICHTHPRFIEEYGGVREIHFSLSCPEAARLALDRANPIRFETAQTDELVSQPNEIDPAQYFALMAARRFAVWLMQDRTLAIRDRFALLLRFAKQAQRCFDEKHYAACQMLVRRWCRYDYRMRQLAKTVRTRRNAAAYIREAALLSELERLTYEMEMLLPRLSCAAVDERKFDKAFSVQAEHLAVLWLEHYIPKAVNDNDLASKLMLAVFGWQFVRRACLCTEKTTLADVMHYAGLFAKEIEHNEENLAWLYAAWHDPSWFTLFLTAVGI